MFDKERVIQILESSGMTCEDVQSRCSELPTWSFLSRMYGDQAVIVGLDTCREHRKNIEQESRKLGGIQVDGLFNVGSNAMAHTLLHNFWTKESGFAHSIGEDSKTIPQPTM